MKNKSREIIEIVTEPRTKQKISEKIYSIGTFIIGSFVFGAALNMFLKPGQIILGGLTGISTTLNIMFGTPIGVVIIILNVPIILIGLKIFGIHAIIKTILGILGTSIALDTLTFLPVTIDDPLLCAIFGGLCLGAGSGILFTRGFTTGGSNLVSLILKRKFKKLSTGKLIMILDFVVITASSIITARYQGIFYSMIAIFAQMIMVDFMLEGADKAKLAYIISPKYQQIADDIFNQLGRGVTILYGRGWYTKDDKCILMCVVKRNELYKIKLLIHSIDPEAFIIFTEATEVMGYGFKSEM